MRPRILLGISVAVALGATIAGSAGAAVTVFGGGIARDCYIAVEKHSLTNAKTLEICDTALEQERLTLVNRAATLVNRGIVYMRDKRLERAMEDFNRALQLEPGLLEAKVNVGAALYGLERYDEAFAMLNEGVEAQNIDAKATAYYNRALIFERRGDVESAYNDYRKALQLVPEFTLAAKQLERFSVVPADS